MLHQQLVVSLLLLNEHLRKCQHYSELKPRHHLLAGIS